MSREDSPLKYVLEYSQHEFFNQLAIGSKTKPVYVKEKRLSKYFHLYLTDPDLNAKTIIVEYDYIDRDFLEDFSAYYVRCFSDYIRKCRRLHFFSIKFSQEDFEAFLDNYNEKFHKSLNKKYLGFIVVKPLPETIFGRTCLKTYRKMCGPQHIRVYPSVREYIANPYGVELKVESLAFQEQDHVVSACATSALWSAFQRTAKLFQHKILSPVETTKAATKNFPLSQRAFPNNGLILEQMIQAIQKLEMEPFEVDIENDEYNLKNCVYSYLSYGIPIILGLDLYEKDKKNGKFIEKGSHAVVITGFRMEEIENLNKKNNGLIPSDSKTLTKASKITKLYVHDDQIGPFAKMEIDTIDDSIGNKKDDKPKKTLILNNAWELIIVPKIFIIPLYHKIRIPIENILDIMRIFDFIIDSAFENIPDTITPTERFEWDIILTDVNLFKKELLLKSGEIRSFRDILELNMPRYIWRVTALYKKEPVLDLLFDATDIEQGNFFIKGVVYNHTLFSAIRTIINEAVLVLNTISSTHNIMNSTSKAMIEWIRDWKKS